MAITLEDTSIPEIKVVVGARFYDERGFFTEMYKECEYEAIGLPRFVQDNLSESEKGVIRGLHWQESPFGQGKLVTCLKGRILDVAVDVRINSSTLGEVVEIELSESEPRSLWIPEGFAHGFQSLESQSRVSYKVTNYWSSQNENAIRFDSVPIKWRDLKLIISEKDKQAQKFVDWTKSA